MVTKLTKLALLISLMIFPIIQSAPAQDLSKPRVWTGKNGHSFHGVFLTIDKVTKKYRFFETRGKKILKIDPSNISKKDLDFISQQLAALEKKSTDKGNPNAFLADEPMDRLKMPVINQSDYGNKASDCVPSSFCNFLLWWDQIGYLPIDRKGDFNDKAEWVHSRTSRYFKTRNNSGTSDRNTREGIKKYFETHLGELATHRVSTIVDCSPTSLAKYTHGSRATFLEVTTLYRGREEGSHWVALVDAKPNGELLMHTWGVALRGKLKLVEANVESTVFIEGRHKNIKANHYKIEFTNPPSDLPEWMVNNEVTFEINPKNSDFLTVLFPYRYAIKGKPSPPPTDPLANNDWYIQEQKRREREKVIEQRTTSISYDDNVQYSRTWNLEAGPLQAMLQSVDGDQVTLRHSKGEITVPIATLNNEEKAAIKLWQGITTNPSNFNEGEITYRLKTPSNPNILLKIQIKNDKFRVTARSENKLHIQDITTGHYSRYDSYDGNRLIPRYFGTLKPQQLCPLPKPSITEQKNWLKFQDDARKAQFKITNRWPSRKMNYPPAYQNRTTEVDIRFSQLNSLCVAPALYFILNSCSGKENPNKNGLIIFPIKSMTGSYHISRVLSRLHMIRSIPVAISWKNNQKYASLKYDRYYRGHYSLVLISIDDSPIDDTLFHIPEAASKIEPGYLQAVK